MRDRDSVGRDGGRRSEQALGSGAVLLIAGIAVAVMDGAAGLVAALVALGAVLVVLGLAGWMFDR